MGTAREERAHRVRPLAGPMANFVHPTSEALSRLASPAEIVMLSPGNDAIQTMRK
jgi:hypothetical protein